MQTPTPNLPHNTAELMSTYTEMQGASGQALVNSLMKLDQAAHAAPAPAIDPAHAALDRLAADHMKATAGLAADALKEPVPAEVRAPVPAEVRNPVPASALADSGYPRLRISRDPWVTEVTVSHVAHNPPSAYDLALDRLKADVSRLVDNFVAELERVVPLELRVESSGDGLFSSLSVYIELPRPDRQQ